jgi:hypothetical protein
MLKQMNKLEMSERNYGIGWKEFKAMIRSVYQPSHQNTVDNPHPADLHLRQEVSSMARNSTFLSLRLSLISFNVIYARYQSRWQGENPAQPLLREFAKLQGPSISYWE